jgi:hypothetical protein
MLSVPGFFYLSIMGLDVHIRTDNNSEVFAEDYHDPKHDYFKKHSLSRTFCNFMCRQHVVQDPELDQIGRITSVDVSPFYGMETYGSDEELSIWIETAENEEEKQKVLDRFKKSREELSGNIDRVLQTVTMLIEKLSSIDNLPALLHDNRNDLLGNKKYFADFAIDKGDGYIGNNFGHDLRNFKRFVKFARSRGAETVYFEYG